MTTHGAPPAQSAAWDDERAADTPTVGWFVRRSALWAAIVLAAVISACALYSIASDVGASDVKIPARAQAAPLKV